MTAPTTQAVQNLPELPEPHLKTLEAKPEEFGLPLELRSTTHYYTADQMRTYALSAISAHEAEVGRLRAQLSDEKTAFYAGYGAAHDDINNSRAPVIQIAWDRRAALTQGETK